MEKHSSLSSGQTGGRGDPVPLSFLSPVQTEEKSWAQEIVGHRLKSMSPEMFHRERRVAGPVMRDWELDQSHRPKPRSESKLETENPHSYWDG